MKRKFKLIFFLTLFLFFILILSDAFLNLDFNKDSWYSLAIMFFFSFSFFQVEILERNINRGASFVKVYLILMKLHSNFDSSLHTTTSTRTI